MSPENIQMDLLNMRGDRLEGREQMAPAIRKDPIKGRTVVDADQLIDFIEGGRAKVNRERQIVNKRSVICFKLGIDR